eukprot:366533-Chlamydomonas_euryale.AAC.3
MKPQTLWLNHSQQEEQEEHRQRTSAAEPHAGSRCAAPAQATETLAREKEAVAARLRASLGRAPAALADVSRRAGAVASD